MKKKLLLTLGAIIAISLGVVGMSAFEAHIINVTAHIENALSVDTTPIEFGTVFPQEQLDHNLTLGMSSSFLADETVDDINYVIKQKPKCSDPDDPAFFQATEVNGVFACIDPDNDNDAVMLPSLCPYLSKTDTDPEDTNDTSVSAFHGTTAWTVADSEANMAVGRLAKSQSDNSDNWNIDLKVPCFTGQCAQDWPAFVTGINPLADPSAYIQPANLESQLFGCDLWVEVTEVSRVPEIPQGFETLSLENKHGEGWFITTDNTSGILQYKPCGTNFEFNLTAQGLTPNTAYSLIYYADGWPGNNPGALIKAFVTDASGSINDLGDSVSLGINLPTAPDTNAPGAKIWLIPSSAYDASTKSLTVWPYDQSWLFEHNLISYNQVCN